MADRGVKKRLFLAINLDKKTRDSLVKIQEILKRKTPLKTAKWVEPENLHISLFFLGDIGKKQLAIILKKLGKIDGVDPFSLSLKNLGFFPDEKNPRVIWVGLSGETNYLKMLYEKIAKALKEEKIIADYRFVPHITLGRVKKGNIHFSPERKIEEILENSEEFKVKTFSLMESVLRKEGPRYFQLKEFILG